MPKADAKNLVLNTVCQKEPAKNQMLKKYKDDLSSISTHRKSGNIRKTEISKSVTVTN